MKCSYIQVLIGCPFYLGDDGKTEMICEGCVDGSRVTQTFRSKEAWRDWIVSRCAENWEDCPIYAGAMEKYQE